MASPGWDTTHKCLIDDGQLEGPIFGQSSICEKGWSAFLRWGANFVSESITVRRLPLSLRPNSSRVLMRPFFPAAVGGTEMKSIDSPRARLILARVLALSEEHVSALIDEILNDFGDRHQRVTDILALRFSQVREYLPGDVTVSESRQLLIGSYFTSEYSLESAALFNPSIIPHPDQTNVAAGCVRVILSLRATGEGPYLLHHFSLRCRSMRMAKSSSRARFTLCNPAAADTCCCV